MNWCVVWSTKNRTYIYIYIDVEEKKNWLVKIKVGTKSVSGSKEFSLLFSLNPLIINHVKRKRERERVCVINSPSQFARAGDDCGPC